LNAMRSLRLAFHASLGSAHFSTGPSVIAAGSHNTSEMYVPKGEPRPVSLNQHTDMEVPDFTFYRRPATRDPTAKNADSQPARAGFTYLMSGGMTICSLYAAKKTVQTLVESMGPAADAIADAQVEIKLEKVALGKNMTFMWRGKPLFVRHRQQEEIDKERQQDISQLRDPERDEERVQRPEWLVVIGVCTHLGCIPLANQGEWGGYYCPCHGSHYDCSGRVRKGPAPKNLEVPKYEFIQDGERLLVG